MRKNRSLRYLRLSVMDPRRRLLRIPVAQRLLRPLGTRIPRVRMRKDRCRRRINRGYGGIPRPGLCILDMERRLRLGMKIHRHGIEQVLVVLVVHTPICRCR